MAGSATNAASAVQRASGVERAARVGHVVSGVMHLLIGLITVRLAFGRSGNADQSGALQELSAQPIGPVLLWLAVAGFAALAVWRVLETVAGKKADRDGGSMIDRFKAGSLAVIYIGFAWSAFGFARGAGKSSGAENAGMSARLIASTSGKVVLVVVALVIIGVGVYHVYKGGSRSFLDDLHGTPSRIVTAVGIAGYVSKGLVLMGAGVLLISAVFTSDPSKATGVDGAVKTLGAQPYGQILLIVAGVGLAIYGLYAFMMARYARM